MGTLFTVLCVALVVAGFFPAIHPGLDTLGLLRPVFAVLCAFGVFWAGRFWVRRAAALAVGVTVFTVMPAFWQSAPGGDLRVYTKNLRQDAPFSEALLRDIRAAAPDVVALQELSPRNDAILDRLADDFPHQHVCDAQRRYGLAVLSRHPFVGPGQCSVPSAAALARIALGAREITVASVHIPWLWPFDSGDNEAAAKALIAKAQGPIVVAGDFNAFPWTGRVVEMAKTTQTQIAGPVRATLYHDKIPAPLPLDYVLAPGGGHAQTRPLFGSDHKGVVADLSVW